MFHFVKNFAQVDRFATGHNSNKFVFFLLGDFPASELYVPGGINQKKEYNIQNMVKV